MSLRNKAGFDGGELFVGSVVGACDDIDIVGDIIGKVEAFIVGDLVGIHVVGD